MRLEERLLSVLSSDLRMLVLCLSLEQEREILVLVRDLTLVLFLLWASWFCRQIYLKVRLQGLYPPFINKIYYYQYRDQQSISLFSLQSLFLHLCSPQLDQLLFLWFVGLKAVFKDLFDCASLLGKDAEAFCYFLSVLGSDILSECLDGDLKFLLEKLFFRLRFPRRPAMQKLIPNNSQSVHITGIAVTASVEHFGTHIDRRANIMYDFLLLNRNTKAEVSDLGLKISIKQYVLRLEISMKQLVLLEVGQPLTDLFDNLSDEEGVERGGLAHEAIEIASSAILHYDIAKGGRFETVKELYNMLRIQLPQVFSFPLQGLLLLGAPQHMHVYDFNAHCLLGSNAFAQIHHAGESTPNLQAHLHVVEASHLTQFLHSPPFATHSLLSHGVVQYWFCELLWWIVSWGRVGVLGGRHLYVVPAFVFLLLCILLGRGGKDWLFLHLYLLVQL